MTGERRILAGCYRGMGDLLYVSSILMQLRRQLPAEVRIDLAAGRGLWSDAVRHLPGADRILPVDSWEEISALGGGGHGYERVLVARVSRWMPFSIYRGWSLRAQVMRLHLIDVLARAMGVRLDPEHRRPVYFFNDADPDDDRGPASALGKYAVVALHGFTHAQWNEEAEERLLEPLLRQAEATGKKLVIVGPPGREHRLPPSVRDLRGAPIRQVATFVDRAALVVSVLNGITVLADALERPILLVAVGGDPLSVVGPIRTRPVDIIGRPGSRGIAGVDVDRLLRGVSAAL